MLPVFSFQKMKCWLRAILFRLPPQLSMPLNFQKNKMPILCLHLAMKGSRECWMCDLLTAHKGTLQTPWVAKIHLNSVFEYIYIYFFFFFFPPPDVNSPVDYSTSFAELICINFEHRPTFGTGYFNNQNHFCWTISLMATIGSDNTEDLHHCSLNRHKDQLC
jgi:hypothetical protein